MATKRTAVRRRLAIRRLAHGPPAGRWQLGHRTIVAPLAATLLATVAVGVGVALARNGRPRRPSAPAPKPRFALLEGEPLAVGLRRAALEQADLAIAMLAVNGASPAIGLTLVHLAVLTVAFAALARLGLRRVE